MYADMYVDSRIRERIHRIHVFTYADMCVESVDVFTYSCMQTCTWIVEYVNVFIVFTYVDMYVDSVDVFTYSCMQTCM